MKMPKKAIRNSQSHKQRQDRENDTNEVGRRVANGQEDESRNRRATVQKKLKAADKKKD